MDDAEGFVKLQRSMNMVGIIEEQQSRYLIFDSCLDQTIIICLLLVLH